MTRSLRFIVPLVAALALASCGGEEEPAERANATTDTTSLLRATFANLGKMQSATVDLKLRIEPRGAAAAQGPVAARLHGPFVSQGPNKLPKFAFTAELQAAGQTISGAAVWTGSKGYVTLQGTPYEISDLVMKQFVAGYEQTLQNRRGAQGGLVLGSLGIDFTKWLKNAAQRGRRRRSAMPRRSRSAARRTCSRSSPTWTSSPRRRRACPARAARCRRS